ncbi:MAG TPA: outer membrane beta-barrel protein [Gemmatimonadales bacterium]|nr:outer membrane beta-barrel protein [Gemmatimonadales bacterium]
MKHHLHSCIAVLAFTTIAARSAQAQEGFYFGVGGGGTAPVGDFSDGANFGWHGLAIIGYKPGAPSPASFRIDGLYGENDADVGSDKFKLAGGLANGVYEFGHSSARPYLVGGIGLFSVKIGSSSNTKFAAGGGAGVTFPVGSDSKIFFEARYISVFTENFNTAFIPLTAGITFGVQ